MELIENALQQGIAPAIVILIYLIVIRILDNQKENKQLKLSADLSNSIISIGNFITTLTKTIIEKDEDKCKKAIEDSFSSSAMRLITFVTSTVINNNVDVNAEHIKINVHNIINREFYSIYQTLSLYTVNNAKASDYLKEEWMEFIEDEINSVIFNKNMTTNHKILTFTNEITIKFQTYITSITNKALNI